MSLTLVLRSVICFLGFTSASEVSSLQSSTFSSQSLRPSSSSSSSPVACITMCCVNCQPDNCDDCYKLTSGCRCLHSLPDRLRDGITSKTDAKDSLPDRLRDRITWKAGANDSAKLRNTRNKKKYRKSRIYFRTLQIALTGTIIVISDKKNNIYLKNQKNHTQK
jgi:hypothetical protein